MKVFKMAQATKEPTVTPLFTGPVTMQTFVGPDQSKRFMIRQVNFALGVRNKFHSHTIEQVLIVTEGRGIVATDAEEIIVTPETSSSFPQAKSTGMGLPKIRLSLTFMSCHRKAKRRNSNLRIQTDFLTPRPPSRA